VGESLGKSNNPVGSSILSEEIGFGITRSEDRTKFVSFSKKIENHAAPVALHFQFYNFARPHKSLKNPYPRTPAMAAGVDDHIWTLTDIARLLD
jgi:hypothetical protein